MIHHKPGKRKVEQVGKPKISTERSKKDEEYYQSISQKAARPQGKLGKVHKLLPDGMTLTRKEMRKEIRKIKKARRDAYNKRDHSLMPSLSKKWKEEHDRSLALAAKEKKLKEKRIKKAEKRKEKREEEERLQKEREEAEQTARAAAKADEQEIKQLEKQLNLNKRKVPGLPQSYTDEGLSYILDAVNPDKVGSLDTEDAWLEKDETDDENQSDISDDGGLDEDSDGREDAVASDQSMDSEEASGVLGAEINEASDLSGNEEDDGLDDLIGGEESEGEFSEEEGESDEDVLSGDDEMIGDESETVTENDESSENEADLDENQSDGKEQDRSDSPELKEDIYGRLRDKSGNVVSQPYVPPAKRRQLETITNEQQQRLDRIKKSLKGQFNRVSESNMVSICSSVEAAYREYSRADVTLIIRQLVSEAILSNTLTPERLCMETAMLISLLHNKIGSEIGAVFLENLVQDFTQLQENTTPNKESKKLDNIVMLLSYLYTFNVTHSLLITDIFIKLIDSFNEKDVEVILLMLKTIGFTLRKDDPVKLKEIILKTQQRANEVNMDDYQDKSRVRFMLDVLLAIKNNNMRKIPNYDPSHLDHLKKVLRGLTDGGRDSKLRISLSDLLQSANKGKWWVVGSAWQGTIDQSGAGDSKQKVESSQSNLPKFSTKLLELARKQRMNTETRRNVFCLIMSSEDYVDAFEKLLRLDLKGVQEREIITVTVECCCNERQYNAYYTHLLIKFIQYHRRFQFTFQTCIWDKFKILSTHTDNAINNLSLVLAQLITNQTISLSILKTVEFGSITKPHVKLIKSLLLKLFSLDKTMIADLFYKVGVDNKLKSLREGLELFIHHFILRKISPEQKQKLDSQINAAIDGLNKIQPPVGL